MGDNNIDWKIIGGFILFYQSWYIATIFPPWEILFVVGKPLEYLFCFTDIGIIIVTISQNWEMLLFTGKLMNSFFYQLWYTRKNFPTLESAGIHWKITGIFLYFNNLDTLEELENTTPSS